MDYIKAISDTEAKYDLKPGVLKKLIEVESGGNLNARSPKGALGLTQLMPETAKEMGVDPHDPLQNIEGGARYLKQGLDKFNGNYAQAIAGYNAGHNNKAVEAMDYNALPNETKKYANQFLDFIVSPANADETPYQENKITWDNPTASQPTNKIVWDKDIKTTTANEPKKELTLGEMTRTGISNIPKSGGEYIGSVAHAVVHPIESAQSILNIANGALQHALPESANKLMYKMNPDLIKNKEIASNVADYYIQRYGSIENLKQSIANDPVGVAGDLASILTLGGASATKIPTLAKVGTKLSQMGYAVEPLNVAAKLLPKVGGAVADVVGGVFTHTGGEPLKQATKAGFEGGQNAIDFAENLRGNAPMEDVLLKAKSNLQEMNTKKSAEYRSGMVDISKDKSVLDMSNIDNALLNAKKKIEFKGQVKDAEAASLLDEIKKKVDNWKALDPAEFHTPEGLDALKQQIGSLTEKLPFEQKTARMVGDNVYHAIKDSIVEQAPVYSKVMKDYTTASDLIHQMERTLSLKGNASVDTALRKLQSVMRNNVNTNYGSRLKLVNQLEQGGSQSIMPSLAGQALSTITPRGLGNLQAGLMSSAGLAAGGASSLPLLLPTLALQSPRLMGETAFLLGKAGRIGKAGKHAKPSLINYLYQAGQDRNKKEQK
jgi:hypothetical protein